MERLATLPLGGLKTWLARFPAALQARSFQSANALWAVVIGAAFLVYFLQFQWVRGEPLLASLRATLVNTAPLLLLGIPLHHLVRRFVVERAIAQQVAFHVIAATIFSPAWYLLVMVVSGFSTDWLSDGFSIAPFYSGATKWQLLQGLTVYAAIQGLTYSSWLGGRVAALRQELNDLKKQPAAISTDQPRGGQALLVKEDGVYSSLAPADILHIEAHGDYVRLHTRQKTHESNKSLSHYAETLEDDGFLRVHRSHLINRAAVLSAEPTGDGRLTIHLAGGRTLTASRAGARLFRKAAS